MGYCPGLTAEATLSAFNHDRMNMSNMAYDNLIGNQPKLCASLKVKCSYCTTTHDYGHPYKCPNCGAPSK
jgi:rubrerythrin